VLGPQVLAMEHHVRRQDRQPPRTLQSLWGGMHNGNGLYRRYLLDSSCQACHVLGMEWLLSFNEFCQAVCKG